MPGDSALDWLNAPLSGAPAGHALEPWAYWHARTMVLAWGLLLPLGALLARFFKVLPGQDWPRVLDHKAWWVGHRVLQWAGAGATALGLWLVWEHAAGAASGPPRLAQLHRALGWLVCVLCAWQVVGGLARGSKGGPGAPRLRGDHYDMTAWRQTFERLHKSLGWLALVLAVAVLGSGLALADAPRWMALALALWWLAFGAAFVALQRAGRCIDTYQAIWGPQPSHPGNQRRPIGWGVRRLPH